MVAPSRGRKSSMPLPDRATVHQINDSKNEPQPGSTGVGYDQVDNEPTSASPGEPGTCDAGPSANPTTKTQEENPTESLPATQKPPEIALENALEKVENALEKVEKALEKAVEKVLEKEQPTDSEAWGSTVTYYEKMDGAMIEGYHAEIDSLLIFAGLFSAILTAFIVQSYQLLQQDSAGISASILANISLQIAAIQSGQQSTGSIQPSTNSLDSFRASRSAVVLNILWFLSLVFSLASAFFGILIKQGLREYLKWTEVSSPRDAVRVRQFRFEAFEKWNVSGVVGALPVLLEIGVVFFMCGLLVLLWTLHRVVAIVITTPVALFLLTSAIVTVLPSFFNSCPLKSPVALAFASIWPALLYYLKNILLAILSGIAWLAHHTLHVQDLFPDLREQISDSLNLDHRDENPAVLESTTWKDRDLDVSEASEKSLLFRSVLGFYSSRTDDKVQENAGLCLRAVINQLPKRLESEYDSYLRTHQDTQPRKVLFCWKHDGLADLVENVLDCDKSTFSIFCKRAYGSDDMRWRDAVSSFGPININTSADEEKDLFDQLRQTIQRLPPKLAIRLSEIIIEDLYNVFDSGDGDLITEERETLIFACCFVCSLRFASISDDDYIDLAESRIRVLLQMFKKVPFKTFLQHNRKDVPIQDLFAWLWSDETHSILVIISNVKLSLSCLRSAIEIGIHRGDDAPPRAGAIMALSMKGLTRAGKTLAYSARGDPRLLEVVRKSIRLIEDTIKLSVAHGIVNCGTPSLEMLDSLANFSEHTSPAGRESILLGIRRGIFTWSMGIFTWSTGKEILSLKSLLEAYRVGHREQVECAKLQKIFIHGGPLPKGWTAHWRPDRPYFVNHNSKLTTWMDPRSNPQSQNDPSAMRDGWLEFAEDDNAPMAGFDGWEKRSCRTWDDAGYFYFVKEDGKKTQIDPRHADDVRIRERWQSEEKPPSYDESAQSIESSTENGSVRSDEAINEGTRGPTANLGPSTGDVRI